MRPVCPGTWRQRANGADADYRPRSSFLGKRLRGGYRAPRSRLVGRRAPRERSCRERIGGCGKKYAGRAGLRSLESGVDEVAVRWVALDMIGEVF